MHTIDAIRRQQIVGAVEANERHRHLFQLAGTVAAVEHRTELGRQQLGDVLVASGEQAVDGGLGFLDGRHTAEPQPRRSIALTVNDPCRGQGRCKRVVDERFTCVRRRFELRHCRARRPGHDEGPARRAEQVVRLRTAGEAARHAESRVAQRRDDATVVGHEPEHRRGGRRGASMMVVAREEHDHRVAAELQHIAAEPEDLVDQSVEDRVQHVVDVLRTAAAEARQSFGQLGETGDVEERQRAIDLDPPRDRGRVHHTQRQIRHVRVQRASRWFGRRW